ncbi:pyridoxamine 5'-phosphate oxidase family protein [Paraflavisolibacter sp. H34]|uniref:pyridoxamine 5'-phosphate oxidase family protein n=1 Tax=Huijunlia imazamoxiresistens TaxID=3127457 RepID=UPI0030185BEA
MISRLNNEQMEELLKQQCIGRIGCHADGVTYVVPISYAYDGRYIYAHTHEGMKVQMMRKNPQVCFEVDDTANMANWKSVIGWGEFEELNEPQKRIQALDHLLGRKLPFNSSATTHLGPCWPFSGSDPGEIKGIVFRILLQKKTGRLEVPDN